MQAIANRVAILHEGVSCTMRRSAVATMGAGALRASAAGHGLGALAGIETVTREDDGAWLLGCADGTAVAMRLAAHAVQAGWGLVELVPAYDALEQLFLRLTAGGTT